MNLIIIFPDYSRSPEARYPIYIEQCCYILNNILKLLHQANLKGNLSITIAGDSVGGNMSIALTLISKYYNGPKVNKLLLYYPVANDDFNTESYNQFQDGYYLYKIV